MPRPPSNGDKRSFEPHADVEVVEVGQIVQRLLRPWVIVLLVVSFWTWLLWPVFGPVEKPYWYKHRFPLPDGGELTYECHGQGKDRSVAESRLLWETTMGTGKSKEYSFPPSDDVEFRLRDDGGAAWVICYFDAGEAKTGPAIEIAVDFATGEVWYPRYVYPDPVIGEAYQVQMAMGAIPEWAAPHGGKLLARLNIVECGRRTAP